MEPSILFQWACLWACRVCDVGGRDVGGRDVGGRDVEAEPRCWNCGVPASVIAQGRWPVRPERSTGSHH
jgi:hypothetical protein